MARSLRLAIAIGLLAALVVGTGTVVARRRTRSKILDTRLVGVADAAHVTIVGVNGAGARVDDRRAAARSCFADGRLDCRRSRAWSSLEGANAGKNTVPTGRVTVVLQRRRDPRPTASIPTRSPFSVPDGNAQFNQKLTLPSPCFARSSSSPASAATGSPSAAEHSAAGRSRAVGQTVLDQGSETAAGPRPTRRRSTSGCLATRRRPRSRATLLASRVHGVTEVRLHHRRRRLGRERAGQSVVGRSGHERPRHRGRPARLPIRRLHPHAGGADVPDRQPLLRLDVRVGARAVHERPAHLPRPRQGPRRLIEHQRPDLPARQSARLRALGGRSRDGDLGLRPLPAVLQEDGELPGGRPRRSVARP